MNKCADPPPDIPTVAFEQDLSEEIGLIEPIGSQLLGLDLANEEELIRRVKAIRAEELIAMAAELSARLVRIGRGPHPDAQSAAADIFLPPTLAAKSKALLPGPPRRVLVHQEQLLIASKVAILHGPAGKPRVPIDPRPVGEVLLAVNDLYDPAADPQKEDEHLVGIVARRSVALGNESTRNLIARYFDLLVRRQQAAQPRLNFDSALVESWGIDITTMMAFGLYYSIGVLHPMLPEELFGPGGFWTMIQALNRAIPDVALRGRLMRCFGADRRWYVDRYREINDEYSLTTTSFLPLQERPIYFLDDGRPILLSPLFMADRMSIGVYWALHAHYATTDPKEGVRSFTAQLGATFQDYVTDLLARVDAAEASVRFLSEDAVGKYSRSGSVVDPSDGFLIESGSLVVIEMTVSAIPISAALSGDGARIRAEVERKYLPKLRQLDRVIGDIASNALILPGIDVNTIQRVRPVLVGLQPFPRLVNTWDLVRELIQAHHLFEYSNCEPVEFVSIEELEMLEPDLSDGSVSLSSLLRDKDDDVIGRHGSVKNYLFLQRGFKERDNETIRKLYFDAAREMSQRLVGLGIVTQAPAET